MPHISRTIWRKESRSATEEEDSEYFSNISGCFVLGCQCLVARFYCDGQYLCLAAASVFRSKRGNKWSRVNLNRQPPSFTLPADKVTQGDIPLELIQTSLRSRLSQTPHELHIKEERKDKRVGNFSLGGSSHQTDDAAFTPATPQTCSTREPTPTHATHTTRNTR
jgi:hypothetical protein